MLAVVAEKARTGSVWGEKGVRGVERSRAEREPIRRRRPMASWIYICIYLVGTPSEPKPWPSPRSKLGTELAVGCGSQLPQMPVNPWQIRQEISVTSV